MRESLLMLLTGYRWAERTENRDAKDEPLGVDDHTCDALRYCVYAGEGGFYFSDSDLS